MCTVFKTLLYRRVKEAYLSEIKNLFNLNKDNFDEFIFDSMEYSCQFSQCSNKLHSKSNRMFRYYLTEFFNQGGIELNKRFFPRTKYYFGLSKRSKNSNRSSVVKYSNIFM